jgi:hypothetical protein
LQRVSSRREERVSGRKRRGSRRAKFEGWVGIAVGDVHRMARGRDLSSRGIGLTLGGGHPFTDGSVETEFALPGIFVPVKLNARVAWADPRTESLGLCFEAIDPDLAELLDNYVAGRF